MKSPGFPFGDINANQGLFAFITAALTDADARFLEFGRITSSSVKINKLFDFIVKAIFAYDVTSIAIVIVFPLCSATAENAYGFPVYEYLPPFTTVIFRSKPSYIPTAPL